MKNVVIVFQPKKYNFLIKTNIMNKFWGKSKMYLAKWPLFFLNPGLAVLTTMQPA